MDKLLKLKDQKAYINEQIHNEQTEIIKQLVDEYTEQITNSTDKAETKSILKDFALSIKNVIEIASH